MGSMEVHIWGSNYHEFLGGFGPATRSKQLQNDRAKGLRAGWSLSVSCSLFNLPVSTLPVRVSGSLGMAPKAQALPDNQMCSCAGRRETHLPGKWMPPKVSMPS